MSLRTNMRMHIDPQSDKRPRQRGAYGPTGGKKEFFRELKKLNKYRS